MKLDRLALEIIRLQAEDVIATSGKVAVGLTSGTNYYTRSKEDSEGRGDGSSSNYFIKINSSGNSISSLALSDSDYVAQGLKYAWYHSGWQTYNEVFDPSDTTTPGYDYNPLEEAEE